MGVDIETGVLRDVISIEFQGFITLDLFKDIWAGKFEGCENYEIVKGYFIDCRSCFLAIRTEEITALHHFFMNHLSHVENRKLAFVIDSADHITIPILLGDESNLFEVKPFSTVEAATIWLNK